MALSQYEIKWHLDSSVLGSRGSVRKSIDTGHKNIHLDNNTFFVSEKYMLRKISIFKKIFQYIKFTIILAFIFKQF